MCYGKGPHTVRWLKYAGYKLGCGKWQVELVGWRLHTMEELLWGTRSQAQDPDVTMANQLLGHLGSLKSMLKPGTGLGKQGTSPWRRAGFARILSHIGVSWNGATPKSFIFIDFSIINHPFWGIPMDGNPDTTLPGGRPQKFELLITWQRCRKQCWRKRVRCADPQGLLYRVLPCFTVSPWYISNKCRNTTGTMSMCQELHPCRWGCVINLFSACLPNQTYYEKLLKGDGWKSSVKIQLELS